MFGLDVVPVARYLETGRCSKFLGDEDGIDLKYMLSGSTDLIWSLCMFALEVASRLELGSY